MAKGGLGEGIMTQYFYIFRNGPKSPVKRGKGKSNYDFTSIDKDNIDDIIREFYGENTFPSINDIYNRIANSAKYKLSFKGCKRFTFYNLMKKHGYKIQNSRDIIRREKITSEVIKQKRRVYLMLKRQLEQYFDFVYLDETYVHKNFIKTKILMPLKNSKKLRLKITIG